MIALDRVHVRAGAFRLEDISLDVPDGAVGVVVGPAGSGKTTLLEAIAGLISVERGIVRLFGADVTREPPERRAVGLVYQHGMLFPHRTAGENVAYGAASDDDAREAAAIFRVEPLLDRAVATLSGGERQLIALARAVARRPRVLLLDEPFSALDPRLRARVRDDVRALQRSRQLTTLLVTHDFSEAGLLGDVVVLLDQGRVLQSGAPADLFARPASVAVAEFLGLENVLAGVAHDASETEATEPARERDATDDVADDSRNDYREVVFHTGALRLHTLARGGHSLDRFTHAVIRADEIVIAADSSREAATGSARNVMHGRVSAVSAVGALTRVTVLVEDVPLVAALTTRSARELGVVVGREVIVAFKATAVHLC